MDAEVLGKLHGYIQWAAEVQWNRREHDVHKREVVALLNKQRTAGFVGNAMTVQELRNLVHGKQLPLHESKKQVYLDIKDTIADLLPLFRNMHVELFLKDILFSMTRVHENTLGIHDALQRQVRLIGALTPQTFEELLPHILYLYSKETQLQQQNETHVADMHRKTVRVMRHLNNNYFQTLKKVSADQKFREDHHDLFVASYMLSLCSRTMAQEYGLPSQDLAAVENSFMGNIAPYQ